MPSTGISLSIEAAGANPEYDASAKKLLSFKSVIAWILKLNTSEFRDYDVEYIANHCISGVSISEKAVHQDEPDRTLSGDERVTLMNSESTSSSDGTVYYDLRLMAKVPGEEGEVCVFINIEIQNESGQKYSLVTRGLYYCARMITEQHGTVFTNMDYQKIRKVYSIWISPNPGGKRKRSTITRYSMAKDNVLGKSFIKKRNYDKMDVVVIKIGKDCEYNTTSITGMLDALLSSDMPLEKRKDILSGVYGIPMTRKIKREVKKVCNLSSGVMEAGRKAGRKAGLKEGRKELLMSLIKLVDKGKLSVEDAADSASMTVEAFLKKKEVLKK